jgi:hypothetical protein
MMHQHPCAEVRERLEEYHDGELPIDEQVAIQGHLGECVGCALAADELDELSASLRQMAADAAPRGSDEAVRFSASVLERLGVEAQFSFVSQVRGLFQDMHLVWAGLGATVATIVCLVGSMSVLHAASQERPDSLAGVIAFLANPGSNANPMPLDVEMMAPRARPGAVIEMSEEDAVFALAAVVTREGRIQNLSVLAAEHSKALRVKPEVVLAMLSEASQAQFEPAIARGGRAIAVNMVWLLTSTTVKGRHDDTLLMVRQPWRTRRPQPIGPAPQSTPVATPAVRLPETLTIG